jgi:hypothetical protein
MSSSEALRCAGCVCRRGGERLRVTSQLAPWGRGRRARPMDQRGSAQHQRYWCRGTLSRFILTPLQLRVCARPPACAAPAPPKRRCAPNTGHTFLQGSHKTFRTKRTLAKKQNNNKPIPQWIRWVAGSVYRLVLSAPHPLPLPPPGPLAACARATRSATTASAATGGARSWAFEASAALMHCSCVCLL